MIFDDSRVYFTDYMDFILRTIRPGQAPILRIASFDYETFLIQPGVTAPKLVCKSLLIRTHRPQVPDPKPVLFHANFDRPALYDSLRRLLLDDSVLLVGAYVAFDLLVSCNEWPDLIPLVFRALSMNRIMCVQLAQQLSDLATNQFGGRYDMTGAYTKIRYSLADLVKRHLDLSLDKDTWRLRYGTLWDVPIDKWEYGAIEYSVGDAVTAAAALQALMDPLSLQVQDQATRRYLNTPERVGAELSLPDVFRQTRAQFWIALMSGRGFRVDPTRVGSLKKLLEAELERIRVNLLQAGLVRRDGSRDTKAAAARMLKACEAAGIPPKMTAGGKKSAPQVALDEDACVTSKDPVLVDYASFTSITGMLSKDVGALEAPAAAAMPIQARFETMVNSGRMSSSGGAKDRSSTHTFQMHNVRKELGIVSIAKRWPKIDEHIGVRQCFVPRPGFALGSIDFSQFELHAWGQASVYLGIPLHKLINALNADIDVHRKLGARFLGISYEEATARKSDKLVKDARQRAKAPNFGFPGGLGANGFVGYAKNQYGLVYTVAEAKGYKRQWEEEWEPQAYFRLVANLVGDADMGELIHPVSMRRRAWVSYTEMANGFFQSLAADTKKEAGFLLTQEMFCDEGSPLYGSRIVDDVHDEFIFEFPLDIAHEAAYRARDIMVETGRRWMPDCPPRAEPALMRAWAKAAETVHDENGRLKIWEPAPLEEAS